MTTSAPTPQSRFAPGTFTPQPGRGAIGRMLFAQAKAETVMTLRHGEQLLLTLFIPIALLLGLSLLNIMPGATDQLSTVDQVTPRVFALAIMSSAFTGQAISLGFDRRYGVIKRLSATALPTWLLLVGRMLAALVVAVIQILVIGAIASVLGWSPLPSAWAPGLLLLLIGTLSFGALGTLLGGSLRAEWVLALANIVWFALLLAGGIVLAPAALPSMWGTIAEFLPSGALAEAWYAATVDGTFAWPSIAVLTIWGIAAAVLAVRTTRLS